MDYEKAYKEALERARVYWETDNDNTLDVKAKGMMEYLFPELRESEDERIRKSIIEVIKESSEILEKQNQQNMIAWLEKQGEQNSAWSKDDENVLEDIEEDIINYWRGDRQDILLDWLKSLKQRIGG